MKKRAFYECLNWSFHNQEIIIMIICNEYFKMNENKYIKRKIKNQKLTQGQGFGTAYTVTELLIGWYTQWSTAYQ